MTETLPDYVSLNGKHSQLVFAVACGAPRLIYWGAKLGPKTTPQMLSTLGLRQEVPASPKYEVPISLTPTTGEGFSGSAGIQLFGDGEQWSLAPTLKTVQQNDQYQVVFISEDAHRHIQLKHRVVLDADSDVVAFSCEVQQLADSIIHLQWCAAATVPTPSHLDQIMGFEGHWGGEFHMQHRQQFVGTYLRENYRGRTSHDSFPGLILHTSSCDQQQGEALGLHLGWSGNHRILAEQMADGRAFVQMGEWLLPGEIALKQHESYRSPTLYAAYSNQGLNGLSHQFHRYVRQHLITGAMTSKPRPVHYNTWEAMYFNQDEATLFDLAERAAELGAERFVMDDGWFSGRHNDSAGLGDWVVDNIIYPKGLSPLIDKVQSLGMEFGLWLEPEMVNPDSDLYRRHPEWVLSTSPNEDVGFRNQLVLDLTRQAVWDHLYARIDALLSEYPIAYLKWDMNRDITQPGDADFRPATHRQTHALYRLLSALRDAHPQLEIESCASGGGRADYGILQYTDRIWTSDSNDALERLKIQRGFSYFFPAELMGSHVGPRDCHITHRRMRMSMRASVALFGHMGLEMDLRELNAQEKTELKSMVALYKQHRALIHGGELYRLSLPDYAHGFGIVAQDKSEALFSYSLTACHTASLPVQYRFAGLSRETLYQLDVIWPIPYGDTWPEATLFEMQTNLPQLQSQRFSGAALMQAGIQLPRLTPQSSLLYHLKKVG